MKKSKIGTLCLLFGMMGDFCLLHDAAAEADARMVELFSRQVHEFEVGLGQGDLRAEETQAQGYSDAPMNLAFRNFYLRTRASFAFEIPSILKLAIVPETELVWQRPWPKGYTAYRPSR